MTKASTASTKKKRLITSDKPTNKQNKPKNENKGMNFPYIN